MIYKPVSCRVFPASGGTRKVPERLPALPYYERVGAAPALTIVAHQPVSQVW